MHYTVILLLVLLGLRSKHMPCQVHLAIVCKANLSISIQEFPFSLLCSWKVSWKNQRDSVSIL